MRDLGRVFTQQAQLTRYSNSSHFKMLLLRIVRTTHTIGLIKLKPS